MFLKWFKILEINRVLYGLWVSRILQFAKFLSEISCLQVRASHYPGVLSPRIHIFVDNNTPVVNISAYFKCIVSYCCSRATLKWSERWSRYVTLSWKSNFLISTKRSPACFFPDEPKSINVELFEYSDGVTRGSVRGRNRPKDCGCPDYPILACISLSVNANERKRISDNFNDSHFVKRGIVV